MHKKTQFYFYLEYNTKIYTWRINHISNFHFFNRVHKNYILKLIIYQLFEYDFSKDIKTRASAFRKMIKCRKECPALKLIIRFSARQTISYKIFLS